MRVNLSVNRQVVKILWNFHSLLLVHFRPHWAKPKVPPLCWRRHISPLSNKRISNFASNIVMLFCTFSSWSEILKSESFGWWGLHSACRAIATSSQYCLFNQLHFSLQNYTRCCTAHTIHYALYFQTLPLEPSLRMLRQHVRIENWKMYTLRTRVAEVARPRDRRSPLAQEPLR